MVNDYEAEGLTKEQVENLKKKFGNSWWSMFQLSIRRGQ
jgi:hypothetical protein